MKKILIAVSILLITSIGYSQMKHKHVPAPPIPLTSRVAPIEPPPPPPPPIPPLPPPPPPPVDNNLEIIK